MSTRHEAGFYGILLDVVSNTRQLPRVANPMIVRFRLPKRLTGTAEELIRLSRGIAFQGAQKFGWRDAGPNKQVNMVGHDDIGV